MTDKKLNGVMVFGSGDEKNPTVDLAARVEDGKVTGVKIFNPMLALKIALVKDGYKKVIAQCQEHLEKNQENGSEEAKANLTKALEKIAIAEMQSKPFKKRAAQLYNKEDICNTC